MQPTNHLRGCPLGSHFVSLLLLPPPVSSFTHSQSAIWDNVPFPPEALCLTRPLVSFIATLPVSSNTLITFCYKHNKLWLCLDDELTLGILSTTAYDSWLTPHSATTSTMPSLMRYWAVFNIVHYFHAYFDHRLELDLRVYKPKSLLLS